MFALSPNVQEVLATRQLAMPLLDPRDTGLTSTAFACNACRRAKTAPAKRRGSTCRKTGCDGHHIFIDFAIPIARCVNRFTWNASADLSDLAWSLNDGRQLCQNMRRKFAARRSPLARWHCFLYWQS